MVLVFRMFWIPVPGRVTMRLDRLLPPRLPGVADAYVGAGSAEGSGSAEVSGSESGSESGSAEFAGEGLVRVIGVNVNDVNMVVSSVTTGASTLVITFMLRE